MPAAYASLLNGAVPLASRHGLLLVRLADSDRTVVHLAVCNLLAGTCDVLPPLKLRSAYDDDREWCAYAVLTDEDCRLQGQPPVLPSNNSSFFKVLIIGSNEHQMRYSFYTFSSRKGKASWRTSINCIRIDLHANGSFSDVLVRPGVAAHWLYSGSSLYLITFKMHSGHTSYTKLNMPMNYEGTGRPCLTLAVDGTLQLLWMHKAGRQLDILVQHPGQHWVCTGVIYLKQPVEGDTEERWLSILGEKCGTILVQDSRQHVYYIELETGTMEEVVGWPHNSGIMPWDSMPLEMDWSAFCISRLRIRYI
jgi:hypothetical protein